MQASAPMKLTLAGIGALGLAILFAGCKPKEANPNAVTLVPAAERSSHFAAVNAHLELGGTLYGYADIDGDILKVAPSLRTLADAIARQQPAVAPFLKQDFAQLLKDLGLNDVRAIGLSSVAAGDGVFRNNVYLYTPDGRHGLLAVLGGGPSAFANARLAPADADLYTESDIDAEALYGAVRALVARVAGEPMAGVFETQLQADASGLGVTPLGVIKSLKGRVTLVLRTDPEATFTLPGAQPFTVPAFQFLAKVDGLGASVGPALAKLPFLTASEEGAVRFYALSEPSPIKGLQPVLAVEGTALYVASDAAFLKASLARKDGLAQAPAFRAALAELGDKGNGLTYVSPRLFTQLRRIEALNRQLPAEGMNGLDFILGSLPAPAHPLIAVRTNLPDGILYRARWYSSLKRDVMMVSLYNPATVGVLAAMAIPAFQKVRTASQEKAILNNLRQLDAAAQQHMLETGTDVATYDQLVGPKAYIRRLNPVDGEDYTKLVIHASDREISVTTRSGKTVRLSR